MFSDRLDWARAENALAAIERARRASGAAIVDLTTSNPTTVGLTYPVEELREALAHPDLATYHPAPRGLVGARAAVAADYATRGIAVDAERVLLTASSSESYSLLFKLLCDPGDSVLVPQPSYPLFEYLARLEGVRLLPYRLAYDGSWHIDFTSVTEALERARDGGRPRALVLVSPNNPTGSFVKQSELQRLAAVCADADLSVISDEVFADYAFTDRTAAPGAGDIVTCAATSPQLAEGVLTFSLGGLSKSCGLPQLKLGWVIVGGPTSRVLAAWERLEIVADTYLSVATPVQLAAPGLLEIGRRIRAQIVARVGLNREQLTRLLPPSSPCSLLAAEGGWSAILRVPAVENDETWAQELLREDGILVHPGYLFDMPPGTYLVPSLLPEPAVFADAVARVLARCGASR